MALEYGKSLRQYKRRGGEEEEQRGAKGERKKNTCQELERESDMKD